MKAIENLELAKHRTEAIQLLRKRKSGSRRTVKSQFPYNEPTIRCEDIWEHSLKRKPEKRKRK